MRQVTATCAACGKVEISTYAGTRYRCAACTNALIEKIRSMAADGMSQGQIATRLGCTQNNISRWCMKAGIVTSTTQKPQQNVGAVHGFGKPPAKLMPTRHAMGLVNIFSLGA